MSQATRWERVSILVAIVVAVCTPARADLVTFEIDSAQSWFSMFAEPDARGDARSFVLEQTPGSLTTFIAGSMDIDFRPEEKYFNIPGASRITIGSPHLGIPPESNPAPAQLTGYYLLTEERQLSFVMRDAVLELGPMPRYQVMKGGSPFRVPISYPTELLPMGLSDGRGDFLLTDPNLSTREYAVLGPVPFTLTETYAFIHELEPDRWELRLPFTTQLLNTGFPRDTPGLYAAFGGEIVAYATTAVPEGSSLLLAFAGGAALILHASRRGRVAQ